MKKRKQNTFCLFERVKGGKWKVRWVGRGVTAESICELWLGKSFAEEYRKQRLNKGRRNKAVGICENSSIYSLGKVFPRKTQKNFTYSYRGW
jgi:hypothetical protein